MHGITTVTRTATCVQPALAASIRLGSVRHLSLSGPSRDASQPAPASSTNPHAARVSAANKSSSSGGDARSRLAKLQAQRLEELNRGRSGSGSSGRPNKPEQKWSNRTLIALATSVGACTYLTGTYHGYSAGKAHAEQAQAEAGGLDPAKAVSVATTLPRIGGALGAVSKQLQSSSVLSVLSHALNQLLPIDSAGDSIRCEPQHAPSTERSCRLAELTQYHCDLHTNRVVCQPIDRIFRM